MYLPSNTEHVTQDYPYGFRLRTEKTDWLEFHPNKGFRHASQTINPKNGKANAAKKSTYSPILAAYLDENGHYKVHGFGFNGDEEIKRATMFLSNHLDLFTEEKKEYFYLNFIAMTKIHMKAMVIYSGVDSAKLIPLFETAVELAVSGLKEGVNNFGKILDSLDWDAINNLRDPNYSPFKITHHTSSSVIN